MLTCAQTLQTLQARDPQTDKIYFVQSLGYEDSTGGFHAVLLSIRHPSLLGITLRLPFDLSIRLHCRDIQSPFLDTDEQPKKQRM